MMNKHISIPIIGYMRSPFREKFGIPRQPNLVKTISYIEMLPPYDDVRAFVGIEQFSHLWLLWQFHDNKRINYDKDFQPMIRPPRLGGNAKIGVFASRSMYRPAAIGLSAVEFLQIKRVAKQTRIYVQGADVLDGTPIVDIKPYLQYADSIADARSGYAQSEPERLPVVWSPQARQQCEQAGMDNAMQAQLEQVLALNPKPAYQHNTAKIYGLRFADWNVRFCIRQQDILIVEIS